MKVSRLSKKTALLTCLLSKEVLLKTAKLCLLQTLCVKNILLRLLEVRTTVETPRWLLNLLSTVLYHLQDWSSCNGPKLINGCHKICWDLWWKHLRELVSLWNPILINLWLRVLWLVLLTYLALLQTLLETQLSQQIRLQTLTLLAELKSLETHLGTLLTVLHTLLTVLSTLLSRLLWLSNRLTLGERIDAWYTCSPTYRYVLPENWTCSFD